MDSAGMMMYMGKNYTGGPQFLSGLEDANITNPSEKDALVYDATNEVWINKSGVVREIVQKTQAQYDALTSEEKHDPTKIYEITDAQTVNADIDDSSVSVGKTWSSSKINGETEWKDVTPTFNVSGSDVASVSVVGARANGSLIQLTLGITNSSTRKTGAGSDYNAGKINAPYVPKIMTRAVGFSYASIMCLNIDTSGNMSVRLLSSEWSANYVFSVTITFPYK